MKKFVNVISPILFIAFLIITVFIYGYTESGNFLQVIPFFIAELVIVSIVSAIAHYNTNEAKREKRKKVIASKRAAIAKAEAEAHERKAKAYQNSTFNFITSYDNEIENTSKGSPFDPIEEIRVELLCRNAMSRYRRNISR